MNPNKKNIETINLFEFLTEDDSKDIDQVKEELSLAGINPDLLISEGDEFINKLVGRRRRELVKERYLNIKSKLNLFMQTSKEVTSDSAKEFLLSILGEKNSEAFQASFRKIENLSDKEAMEMLNEKQLLELLTKLMNEGK